jgi:hypothetical protein
MLTMQTPPLALCTTPNRLRRSVQSLPDDLPPESTPRTRRYPQAISYRPEDCRVDLFQVERMEDGQAWWWRVRI